MPAEDLAPAIELFRHRFLHALRDAKLISPRKLANLLSWKHPGFNIDNGGEQPVPAYDADGRKRLAEYLLRHPFSLQKITWNASSKTVRTFIRHEEIQFFLRLHGLWEGIIHLPRPPPPPFDIETMEPIEPPWQAIKEWIPDDEPDLNWFNQERAPEGDNFRKYDQRVHRSLGEGVSSAWQPEEVPLGDGQTLVLDPT
jgi:hypothetical protein